MCYQVSKYTLAIVNGIFSLFSLIALGIGIWLVAAKNRLPVPTDEPLLNNAIILFIAISVVCLVVSLIGCLGSIKEHKSLLIGYVGVITVLLALQLLAIGLAAAFRAKIEAEVRSDWLEADKKMFMPYNQLYEKYNVSADQISMSHLLNSLHVMGRCCGVDNYTDITQDSAWSRALPMYNKSEMQVPASCCILTEAGVEYLKNPDNTDWSKFSSYLPTGSRCPTELKDFNNKGCWQEITDSVKKHVFAIIMGSAIYIAIYAIHQTNETQARCTITLGCHMPPPKTDSETMIVKRETRAANNVSE